jgi:hypothetical protein
VDPVEVELDAELDRVADPEPEVGPEVDPVDCEVDPVGESELEPEERDVEGELDFDAELFWVSLPAVLLDDPPGPVAESVDPHEALAKGRATKAAMRDKGRKIDRFMRVSCFDDVFTKSRSRRLAAAVWRSYRALYFSGRIPPR